MRAKFVIAAFFAALLVVVPFAVAQDGEDPGDTGPAIKPPPLHKLLAEKAASIVTLRCVLNVQITAMGQTQEEERNLEVAGVLVNKTGLVLTANTHFEGGMPPAVKRMLEQMGQEFSTRAVPTDLKVQFGTEVEEYEARLVARDSNLDLAFVQIVALGDREITFVDLQTGGEPVVGQDLFGATRMGKGFDYAPRIGRMFVGAALERPRKMWSVTGEFQGLGHPVFDLYGQPVGVLSVQEGSQGVSDDGGGMFGGLGAAESILTVIIPRSDVIRSLAGAEARAAETLADIAAGGDGEKVDAPDESDTPDESETPDEPDMPDEPDVPDEPDMPDSPDDE